MTKPSNGEHYSCLEHTAPFAWASMETSGLFQIQEHHEFLNYE